MNSFDFSLGGGDSARRAFRAQIPGLEGWLKESQQGHPIKDISATGFAIMPPDHTMKEGDLVHMDLLINKRLYIGELPCQVVRVLDNGIVGFDFLQLDRRQEARLDKLVLEVQKRIIAKKRTGSDED